MILLVTVNHFIFRNVACPYQNHLLHTSQNRHLQSQKKKKVTGQLHKEWKSQVEIEHNLGCTITEF